jgi:bacterioferritin (cytochrome b1)
VAVTKDMLVSELQNLLRLTAFEQTIATVRRSQAGSAAVAEELRANAEKSGERSRLLQEAVRQVGGVPDVVGATLGRVGAFAQTQLNQVQTLQNALLGDLALEHQLRERTRYARTLAESLGYFHVLPVLDRLETAHSATIEWLEARLSEVGRTGTSALKATPVQVAAGAVRRVTLAPYSVLSASVNRGTSLLRRGASQAADTVSSAAGTAVATATDAAQAVQSTATTAASSAAGVVAGAAGTTGSTLASAADSAGDALAQTADVVGDTTERAADVVGHTAEQAGDVVGDTAGRTADAVADTAGTLAQAADDAAAQAELEQVLDLTDVDEGSPPFAGYPTLSGDSVMRHVRDSEDVEHLREILAFEQAHKARKGVLGALHERLAELTGAPTPA